MIFGIGTDIVQVSRMQGALDRHGKRFAERILSDEEYREFSQAQFPAKFLAKRFAAKEAAAKALGTGFRHGLSLRHIRVCHDDNGRPLLELQQRAQTLADERAVGELHLSLADESEYAIAYVILMKQDSFQCQV